MAKAVLLTLAAVILILVLIVVAPLLKGFMMLALFAVVGVGYGWYFLLTALLRVEFEYAVTNGEIDIDRIVAQRKRKRLITVNLRNAEIMAPVHGEHAREFANPNVKTTIDASASPDLDSAWFVIVSSEKLGLTKVILTPDERVIAASRAAAPRKVFEK